MTYNVFGGTLNLALSVYVRCTLFALTFLPKIAHAASRFVCAS